MKKKIIASLTVAALLVGALTACGSKGGSSDTAKDDSKDNKVIKIAATAVPHAEILEEAKPILEKGRL